MAGNAAQKTLFSLGWTIDELSRLSMQEGEMRVETQRLQDLSNDENCDLVQENIASRLNKLSASVTRILKGENMNE